MQSKYKTASGAFINGAVSAKSNNLAASGAVRNRFGLNEKMTLNANPIQANCNAQRHNEDPYDSKLRSGVN